jgi:ketosteroid isomerase-like protein
MKKLLASIPLIVLLCCVCGCQGQRQQAAEEPVADVEAEKQNVEKVIYDFFDAIFAFNYEGIRDLCTDDFILFESGQVMNVDGFLNFLTPFEGSTTTYEFEDIKTSVEGSVAWMSLRNKAVMTMGEEVINFDWLESAVLKKQEGLWKLAFYHSTTVESPEEK